MINFFDLGMYNGRTTNDFLDIMKKLNVEDYTVYGFESYTPYFENCVNKYKKNNRIHVINVAITNGNKKEKVYKSANSSGYSIFSDKHNIIDTNSCQETDGILFSEWFNENIRKDDVNLLHVNIEGAEYYFFNDIIDTGVYKNITLFFGWIDDIKKIASLSNKYNETVAKLKKHDIVLHKLKDSTETIKGVL